MNYFKNQYNVPEKSGSWYRRLPPAVQRRGREESRRWGALRDK